MSDKSPENTFYDHYTVLNTDFSYDNIWKDV